ncbi:hypothetical protein B0H17DRAFT_1214001 [Mycena rosella]|uniref:Uncharacterized protein n=1 Tax=Mycena rosella TaxID=1033263 RepID=A0AAD7CNX2_MYCRO|nr:hypothetical protein B0H17DRAFT_1214001 [Mycena rosella]
MDSLETLIDLIPVHGLNTAYKIFRFILSSVKEVQDRKKQFEALAIAIGQLLRALDSEFRASRLIVASCGEQLRDLENLLQEIHRFVHKEQQRDFLMSLLTKDSRIAKIEIYYRRIGTIVSAFEISSLLSIQSMLERDQTAWNADTTALNARLSAIEHNQVDLQKILGS